MGAAFYWLAATLFDYLELSLSKGSKNAFDSEGCIESVFLQRRQYVYLTLAKIHSMARVEATL